MTNVHMKRDGSWAVCRATQRACPRLFHAADLTPAEAKQLPASFIEQLTEAFDPPTLVDGKHGTRSWWRYGSLHRDYDLPARVRPNGTREWFQHGERHRGDDKPAILYQGVSPEWWEHGKCKRSSGGPNRIDGAGIQYWFDETGNQLHREGDLPAQIDAEGNQWWYQNGVSHREGGKPAYVGVNGETAWMVRGKFHRLDGPAYVYPPSDRRRNEWWLYGEQVTKQAVVDYVKEQGRLLQALQDGQK